MTMLADAAINPLELGQFLLTLAALAGLYLKLRTAARELAGRGELREITPQPLEVTKGKSYVATETCHLMHKSLENRVVRTEMEIESLKRMIQSGLAKLEASHEERIVRLHSRIDEVAEANEARDREILRAIGRLEGAR